MCRDRAKHHELFSDSQQALYGEVCIRKMTKKSIQGEWGFQLREPGVGGEAWVYQLDMTKDQQWKLSYTNVSSY